VLFVTDATSYVIKDSTALKGLFPNMTLLTCFSHALDRAAEAIRANFPLVNKLMYFVSKVCIC
jgi:hypothetical protein